MSRFKSSKQCFDCLFEIFCVVAYTSESQYLRLENAWESVLRMVRKFMQQFMCVCRFEVYFGVQNALFLKSGAFEDSNIQKVYRRMMDSGFKLDGRMVWDQNGKKLLKLLECMDPEQKKCRQEIDNKVQVVYQPLLWLLLQNGPWKCWHNWEPRLCPC